MPGKEAFVFDEQVFSDADEDQGDTDDGVGGKQDEGCHYGADRGAGRRRL